MSYGCCDIPSVVGGEVAVELSRPYCPSDGEKGARDW